MTLFEISLSIFMLATIACLIGLRGMIWQLEVRIRRIEKEEKP